EHVSREKYRKAANVQIELSLYSLFKSIQFVRCSGAILKTNRKICFEACRLCRHAETDGISAIRFKGYNYEANVGNLLG
ncbi:MAG: hypothetical protein IJL71_04160, partial [Oscillospiraceae bacterium]|nr:hypothetical protein [Oscillospiraceae bacterium]